jgi:GNAT superfamily N-acetyltransferase
MRTAQPIMVHMSTEAIDHHTSLEYHGNHECQVARALRRMVDSDVPVCVDLISRSMNAEEGAMAAETFRFHFACRHAGLDDGRQYQVLPRGDQIVAITGLHHYHWGPPENVWLAWFAIDPAWQGTGLGQSLIGMMENLALASGFRKLLIETYSTPTFARARGFYRKMGYAEMGMIRRYLPCGGDMIVFAKNLTSKPYETIREGRNLAGLGLSGPAADTGHGAATQPTVAVDRVGRSAPGCDVDGEIP